MHTPRAHLLALVSCLVVEAPRALAQAAPPAVHLLSSTAEATASRRPVWSGVADPGRVVVLSLDGRPLGRALADAGGSWAFVAPVDLAEGAHSFGAWVAGADPLGDASVRRSFSVVACGASADCDGATPVCDAASTCRACRDDAECASGGRTVCSRRGATQGMCVAPAPAVTSPPAGYAVAERFPIEGEALPRSLVAVLVDGREVGRAVADARGAFRYELSGLSRAWHDVSAAQVESGLVGEAGDGHRVLSVECSGDRDCGAGRRCDLARFACAAR